MVKQLFGKFDGWPAAAIGTAAVVTLAYFAYISYQRLEDDRARILSELGASRDRATELIQTVRGKQEVIDSFEGEISKISSTVGVLDKLAHTDEELLMKYSKVYFLNENYVPARLSDIDAEYRAPSATNYMIHTDVLPHLKTLMAAAHDAGLNLLVASAFRSFDTQSTLKSAYSVTYGSGANAFSADQGYSEHQLGTAVDFTTVKLGANFSPFATEPAYKWLLDNAYKYGFIISYPEGNSYYKYEPWHWRFVGVELASKLHEDDKHFYDLDQREIDKYLVNLFD